MSANSALRESFVQHAEQFGWNIYIPKFGYTTDNAAMIAISGYYKYLSGEKCDMNLPPYSRVVM
ncbi:hypothetical protein MASR1M31_08820 [Porphyromonadaceae bacterium]